MQDKAFSLNLALKYARSHQTGPRQTGLIWTRPCTDKPRPAPPNRYMRCVLFWDITQCRVLIPYQTLSML